MKLYRTVTIANESGVTAYIPKSLLAHHDHAH
jgi:hypothetical protein